MDHETLLGCSNASIDQITTLYAIEIFKVGNSGHNCANFETTCAAVPKAAPQITRASFLSMSAMLLALSYAREGRDAGYRFGNTIVPQFMKSVADSELQNASSLPLPSIPKLRAFLSWKDKVGAAVGASFSKRSKCWEIFSEFPMTAKVVNPITTGTLRFR